MAGTSPPPERDPVGPGQESVWDFPRPPRVEPCHKRIEVDFAGLRVADTTRSLRVLETSLAPSYYVPADDVRTDLLRPAGYTTQCEWKGTASHYDVVLEGRVAERAAWVYRDPTPAYRALGDHYAFYPARVDACRVDGVAARAQEGGFYGGWLTPEIVGPVKGGPGTEGW